MEDLKIFGITTENVKNLKLIHFEPSSNVIVVTGKNAAGKSAFIDSMWMAIAGKVALKNVPNPIRDGEKNAKVEVDLGEIKVTRTWTPTNTYLKIENKDQAVFKSPQAMLDKFNSNLSFDPGEFSQMSEKEQATTLMNLLGLKEHLDKFEASKKKVFDERTIVNRQVKDIEAQIKGIVISDNVPDEEISSVAILENYQKASDTVADNKLARNRVVELVAKIEGLEDSANDLQRQLDQKVKALNTAKSEHASEVKRVATLIDPDLEGFKCRLEDVEKINISVRLKAKKDGLLANLVKATEKAKALTQQLIDLASRKSTLIRDADMPINDIGFDEHGVTYKDQALKQCSSAEQLRVSIAVAMALNPTLKVIRIADGSLLDSTNMKVVEEMAEAKGYQVWIEVVDESGDMGVFIEDGKLAKDNYAESAVEA